jgi:hypothetical protein
MSRYIVIEGKEYRIDKSKNGKYFLERKADSKFKKGDELIVTSQGKYITTETLKVTGHGVIFTECFEGKYTDYQRIYVDYACTKVRNNFMNESENPRGA